MTSISGPTGPGSRPITSTGPNSPIQPPPAKPTSSPAKPPDSFSPTSNKPNSLDGSQASGAPADPALKGEIDSLIKSQYQKLLGRDPDAAGLGHFEQVCGELAKGSSSLTPDLKAQLEQAVDSEMSCSSEAQHLSLINSAYQSVLGRDADMKGARTQLKLVDRLEKQGKSPAQIQSAVEDVLKQSAEGKQDTAIDQAFQAALGRRATPAELTHYAAEAKKLLKQGCTQAQAEQVIQSVASGKASLASSAVGIQNDGWRPSDGAFAPIHAAADAANAAKNDADAQAAAVKALGQDLGKFEGSSLSKVSTQAQAKITSLMAAAAGSGAQLFRTQVDAKFLPPSSVGNAYKTYADATDAPSIGGFEQWLKGKPQLADANKAVAEALKTPAGRTNLDAQLVYAAAVRGECAGLAKAPSGLSTDVVIGLDGADRHLENDHTATGVWNPKLMSPAGAQYVASLTDKAVFAAQQFAGSGAKRVELGNELNQPDKSFKNGYNPDPKLPDSIPNITRRVAFLNGTIYQAVKANPACRSLTVDATSMMFAPTNQNAYPDRAGDPKGVADPAVFLKNFYQAQRDFGLLTPARPGQPPHIASDELNLHFYGTEQQNAGLIKELSGLVDGGHSMLPSSVFVSEVGKRFNASPGTQTKALSDMVSSIAQNLASNKFKLAALSIFGEPTAGDGNWGLADGSLPGMLASTH